jgi:cystathionine beta-lyase/cystathionine gamma-synthase
MDPHGAVLLMRGMRTLGLRVQRCSDTCYALAQYLQGKAGITAVHYPWLKESPSHNVATKQMRAGGGLLSFEVAGGLTNAQRFVDALRLVTIATSLGGIETVVEVPSELDWHESEGAAVGAVPAGLVRLSVGIEDLEDLRADLHRGLSAIRSEPQRRPHARAVSVP